jgi:hypothetical protein
MFYNILEFFLSIIIFCNANLKASKISSYEVASLSNTPSLSTAVLKEVISLSNLGLIAIMLSSNNILACPVEWIF